jgi:predicted DNA-binding transcriptional regulator AlpA
MFLADDDDTLLPIAQVKASLGGCSHMLIERRLKDDPTFPKPVYIGNRRYWRRGELAAWKRSLVTRQDSKHVARSRAALAARQAAVA